MDFNAYFNDVVAFVRAHAEWTAPVVFLLAFGESLAFISLLIPAWGALVAIGALINAGGVNFWPVWIAGSLGAALGDWLSYWVGRKLEYSVQHIWPLSRHPDLIPRGEAFVKTWGIPGIFIGRFFGPLRASVPLVAGIFEMPFWRFQFANFSLRFRVGGGAAHAWRCDLARGEMAVVIVRVRPPSDRGGRPERTISCRVGSGGFRP